MSGPAELYVNFLAGEGYRPTVDSDGDVVFKHEGGSYFIAVNTQDPAYFRLVFPGFWSIDSDQELEHAILEANNATMNTKVAKVFVISERRNTWAAIELFFADSEQFAGVFERSMAALRHAVDQFVRGMRQRGYGGSGS
jgi:hypothetical protein